MLNQLTSPTLLIDESRVRRNLQRMADRAKRHGLALRPHFKTHQSGEVGEWCRDYGVEEITVTSLRMAREFADRGWRRIVIAMPINPRELPALCELAVRIDELSVFLTDVRSAASLGHQKVEGLHFFIEIDAGYGRSGVNWMNGRTIEAIVKAAGRHRFRGFYVHSGHTYDAGSLTEIGRVHASLLARIQELRKSFHGDYGIAIGDTPACSTQENFAGVTSIGPGNFIYYDLTQAGLGACTTDDIAVCLAAPVVQVIPERREAIIHGGWVQLGKDQLTDGSYGRMVKLGEDGRWGNPLQNAFVKKLSQEHGTLRLGEDQADWPVTGDLIGILPVHACATVHGMRAAGDQVFIRPQ